MKDFKNSLIGSVQGIGISSRRIACVGSACPSNGCIADGITCKKLGGFVNNNVCIACAANENYINGKCIPACGNGQEYVNGVCVPICDKNQYLKNGQCVCKIGFILRYQNCVSCPSGST